MNILAAGIAVAMAVVAVPSRSYEITPQAQQIQVPAILRHIANCESGNRQFESDGRVVRGNQNRHDIGRFQINELIWGGTASALGYDIYTDEGNTKMALWIFNQDGARPWFWSKACWSKDNG